MKSDKLGICVIGAGRAGLIHAFNFAKGIKDARLKAIAEPNRETAQQACRELELDRHYQDYRQALEDDAVDAVVVVTPTSADIISSSSSSQTKSSIFWRSNRPIAFPNQVSWVRLKAFLKILIGLSSTAFQIWMKKRLVYI